MIKPDKTVAFYTLGCKVNQYDAQAMMEIFERAGYQTRPFGEQADVNVVVTCVVTAAGEQKSRQMLHRVRREQPHSHLVAAGCLAQKDAEKLKDLGVRLILGNQHREQVVQLLEQAIRENSRITAVEDVLRVPYEELSITRQEGRTRAVMKIQEGCDRYCAYCIIPYVRGGIRSRTPEAIAREAKRLVHAGYREIVLTGIHLTSYGRDLGGLTLLDAVRAAAVDGLNRLRLGSLEPVIASAAFVESLAHIPVVCPQFHLSLQSGSDSMLRRMRRRYTAEEYLAAARRLQDAFPGCALTTDVLVGFPGETQEEFEQTLAFCEQVGFAKMHIFPFSRRAGTAADRMPGQLSRALKTERARQMAALEARMSKGFMASFLGSSQDVLFETLTKDGLALGHTPNAINVYCPGGSPGKIQKVRLLAPLDDGLRATLLSSS
ncbi:MAG TPA: tRNA (N(6)-L-threonylcarbamoyladenosine(37)-C(2))-methylthiotransferase MtaB [Clostridia bacterium]|nr:tRNA (N(6)-L-threonylcarbamoyladenosine(37)-C(2))-methylthiotransferase MtaB [Clostridia bacterium]HPY43675.1 tRNA (N(6)-L-threonylcarbamoyladenosine(37)-C(2))-methylthiotransferase MtaB [Clostridia bacterium]HQA97195.1 tRNA (N(6)-L-threonylcarbamoyladenosine(37)-C(2))-methylthiotransferase MtaB [Clostridia bacterium]HQO54885.1 tRNA (N(6)-L-threonylcarbamoyladenosine(37)-C(2))-methylthiotransferase MtaB [Clostridia bacterium]HUM60053.1 tRNA (N(6)-L-threonylcarbamoyladenosine(37)-C(2))-methyl